MNNYSTKYTRERNEPQWDKSNSGNEEQKPLERNDKDILQHDLNILQQWNDKWLLKFHPDKCKHDYW